MSKLNFELAYSHEKQSILSPRAAEKKPLALGAIFLI